jgi:hypothetical protein
MKTMTVHIFDAVMFCLIEIRRRLNAIPYALIVLVTV